MDYMDGGIGKLRKQVGQPFLCIIGVSWLVSILDVPIPNEIWYQMHEYTHKGLEFRKQFHLYMTFEMRPLNQTLESWWWANIIFLMIMFVTTLQYYIEKR
jgi:multidrug efflux pump subunit AcrB